MPYLYLTAAIAMELVATTLLKYSDGFSKLRPTLLCIISYIICYYSLSKALRHINLGIAYATWCGVGIIATALISVLIFKESLNIYGLIGIILITAGCIILNLLGTAH